jgi:Flp pilus assembly protein TadD
MLQSGSLAIDIGIEPLEGYAMSGKSEPVGTVEVALAHATRLLESNPALAAEQAEEILKVHPGHPAAALLLGIAKGRGGESLAAVRVLEQLVAAHPKFALAHYELAVAYGNSSPLQRCSVRWR